MKKPLILIILSFSVLSLAAQRVDLDRFYFNVTYRGLPRQPLDTSYHTYSVKVETGPLAQLAMKNEDLSQEVVMEGWRKLNGDAHISVDVHMQDVIIEKSEVKERDEILKDKKGNQIGVKKHFAMQLTYTYGAHVNIIDYRGTRILDLPMSDRTIKRIYTSSEYGSKAEAQIYFAYNVIPVTSQIMRQVTHNTLRDLSRRLTTNYGFTQRTVTDFMWILGSRKHPEYEAHRRAWLVIKQAFFQMNADEPVDKVKEMLQPAIAYFNKVTKNYTSSNRKVRKLRYASYYNLAKIYYYLDDPDAAMREATELVLNNFDTRDGRQLESAANNLKWLLQQNKVQSRHFPIYVDEMTGPAMTTAASGK